MSSAIKMCISQTIIILGVSLICLFSMTWLQIIGMIVVFVGSYIGQTLLSNVELELDLYKLDYPLDKS